MVWPKSFRILNGGLAASAAQAQLKKPEILAQGPGVIRYQNADVNKDAISKEARGPIQRSRQNAWFLVQITFVIELMRVVDVLLTTLRA
jgi:hypothetical protein